MMDSPPYPDRNGSLFLISFKLETHAACSHLIPTPPSRQGVDPHCMCSSSSPLHWCAAAKRHVCQNLVLDIPPHLCCPCAPCNLLWFEFFEPVMYLGNKLEASSTIYTLSRKSLRLDLHYCQSGLSRNR